MITTIYGVFTKADCHKSSIRIISEVEVINLIHTAHVN